MKQQEIAQICFEILGRYFPGESGKDTEELREILGVDKSISEKPDKFSMTRDAAAWKSGAAIWLANNMSFRKIKKV